MKKEEIYTQIREALAEQDHRSLDEISDKEIQPYYEAYIEDQECATAEELLPVHVTFARIAARYPEAIAISDKNRSLSFHELNTWADKIAVNLINRGILPGSPIGLTSGISAHYIATFLGILKAGGIVVPIDSQNSEKRKQKIISKTGVAFVIEENSGTSPIERSNFSTKKLSDINLSTKSTAFIDTSGENLVTITHLSLALRITRLQIFFESTITDVFAWQGEYAGIRDWLFLWPLCHGVPVVCPSNTPGKPFDNQNPTITQLTPSELSKHLNQELLPLSLRSIICSGEPLSRNLVDLCSLSLNAQIYNLWLAPESALSLAPYHCNSGLPHEHAPIGTSNEIFKAQFKNQAHQPISSGLPGYLYLSGPAVSNNIHETGEFSIQYSDGSIQLLASKERQYWIKGVQVNLANIEYRFMQEPGVIDCVVLPRKSTTEAHELIVYLLPDIGFSPRNTLAAVNADMTPGSAVEAIVLITSMPLKNNGEIDLNILEKIPVTDVSLFEKIEDTLLLSQGVKEAYITAENEIHETPSLHLSTVLPSDAFETLKITDEGMEKMGQPQRMVHQRPPALSKGKELRIPTNAPKTMTEALVHCATYFPNKGMCFVQSHELEFFLTYSQLLTEAKQVLTGLQAKNMKPGDRVILQLQNLRDHYLAFWGCVLGGITPVAVAIAPSYEQTNAVNSKVFHTWELLEQPIILTNERIVGSIKNLETLFPMSSLNVLTIEKLLCYSNEGNIHFSEETDVVFMQLTSGSTGAPKCIQETHKGIIAHIHAAQQFNHYRSEDVSLNWLPLDHVVPILTCHLKDIYLGCNQVLLETATVLANPLSWLEAIEQHKATHTWSPNFGFKLVADALIRLKEKKWDLSSMKFFMNAGEQVTLPVIREFLEQTKSFGVVPGMMQPAFGMAEVCTCMTYQNNFSLETGTHRLIKSSLQGNLELASIEDANVIEFVRLGSPVPGVDIRITDEQNKLLPEGVIGRFQIKGDVVTPGYLNNIEANREAFVGDGWFNSGDLGYILEGELILTGREKETIIIRGANFYCYEIEDVVNSIEGVEPTFSAAAAVKDPNTGTESLAIFFVPKTTSMRDYSELVKKIRTTVTAHLGITPAVIVPLLKDEFAKTTSGKIQRTQMKKNFMGGKYANILMKLDLELKNEKTIPEWFFRSKWVIESLRAPSFSKMVPILVFENEEEIGKQFIKTPETIFVQKGTCFARHSEKNYAINPALAENYLELFLSLKADNLFPQAILHLWTLNNISVNDDTSTCGTYGLLSLIQSLIKAREGTNSSIIRLLVASSSSQAVFDGEKIIEEYATMHGILKTIQQEFPSLLTAHVDLPKELDNNSIKQLAAEFQSSSKGEVAIRNGRRFSRALERIKFTKNRIPQLPFKRGGTYVISGGTGGIGMILSKYLLQHWDAHVILLGRSPLIEKAGKIEDLRQYGGTVTYLQVDITQQETLTSPLLLEPDGIFHLAGTFKESLIVEETVHTFQDSIRSKTEGVCNLFNLIEAKPQSLFVVFSSVNSFFGGFKVSAYSAANRFLDAFCSNARTTHSNVYCLEWSQWHEIGMSAGNNMKALVNSKGFKSIPSHQGLQSLLTILCQEEKACLIGLDSGKSLISRYLHQEASCLSSPLCYFTAEETLLTKKLDSLDFLDRFGTPVSCKLVLVDNMPKNEQGEVDPNMLRSMNQSTIHALSAKRTEPSSELESSLVQIWSEVLQLNSIGIHDNFFELGGHSLIATQVVSRIREKFAIELPLAALFSMPTISGLAKVVEKEQLKGLTPSVSYIRHVSKDQPLPLSFSQERLWFMDQMNPGNSYYNLSEATHLYGILDVQALKTAFKELISRHEVLRTTFKIVNNEPYQQIHEEPVLDFQVIENFELNHFIEREARQGFDLSTDPLLRIRLLKQGPNEHIIVVTMHHIVADAWSVQLLLKEITELYQASRNGREPQVPKLPIQFADYAAWQRDAIQSEKFIQHKEYWKKQLRNYSGILEIPGDRSRPSVQTFKGKKHRIELPQDLIIQLKELSQKSDATLFMTLFASFSALLSRYTGQMDLVIGTPVANRNRFEIEPLIGCFVNTLPLRSDLSGNPTFAEFLSRIQTSTLNAYEHQDMPFEKIVELLNLRRDVSRQPLCQIVFVLQNVPMAEMELDGLHVESIENDLGISKFDMTLSLVEMRGKMIGAIEYNTDIYDTSTIEKFEKHWLFVLQQVVENPLKRLSELSLLNNLEWKNLLGKWNESLSHPLVSAPEFISQLQNMHPEFERFSLLTPVQRDLYLDYLLKQKSTSYNLVFSQNLGRNIDQNRWIEAVVHVCHSIDICKTRFFSLNGEFYQFIDNSLQHKIEYHEINVEEIIATNIKHTYSLFESPIKHILVHNTDGNYIALIGCHHIVLDAQSAKLFFDQVVEVYKNGCICDSKISNSFYTCIEKRIHGFDTETIRNYWTSCLSDISPFTSLGNSKSDSGIRIESIKLNQQHIKQIENFCNLHQISIPLYFKSLFGLLLYKYYAPELNFLLFDVLGGRTEHEAEVIGCLYQILPIIFDSTAFEKGESIIEIMKTLKKNRKNLGDLQNISVLMQRQLLKDSGDLRFFINYYHFSDLRVHESFETNEVHLIVEEKHGEIELRLCYNQASFNSLEFLKRLNLVSGLILSGADKMQEICILLENEKTKFHLEWNNHINKSAIDLCIHERFDAQARKTPHAIALTFNGEILSYQELSERSNQFAHHLRKEGIDANTLVGLYMDRSIQMMVALLGILKAGGAYVPIDPQYPRERIEFMIKDASINFLVTETRLIQKDFNINIIYIDKEWDNILRLTATPLSNITVPSNDAYVIYTSGSTGDPKGAIITHENVIRLFDSTAHWFNFNSNDVWTLFHSHAFDFSVWEMWGALFYGGKLIIIPHLITRSPKEFYQLLCDEKVSVLNQTPSAFIQLIQEDSTLNLDYSPLALRYIIFGGEALNFNVLTPWIDRHGIETPKLINMYGITETTVHVTYKLITEEDLATPSISNIGTKIPDLSMHILDQYHQPVPIGIAGELYIGGAGVARGYLNRSELTSQRFVNINGDKLYRSGDLARMVSDGSFEYLGRIDHQVKIRGFRIELGEIETSIRKLPGISEVAVIAEKSPNNEISLIAYIASKYQLNSAEIKTILRQNLPEYMIPTDFISLEKLPITSHGKLDRKALPKATATTRISSGVEYVAPQTDLESLIIHCWQDVLGIERIGLNDNFYDLGGHSLKMVQLQNKLNEKLNEKINHKLTLVELFQYPTVQTLAASLIQQLNDDAENINVKSGRDRAQKRQNMRNQFQKVQKKE